MMTNEKFLIKFRKALMIELQYYTGTKQKRNLSREEFLKVIKNLNLEYMSVRFNDRTASVGKNSKTGEKVTFHLNFEVRIGFITRMKAYYCHGYFYDADLLRGVFIHSFREN